MKKDKYPAVKAFMEETSSLAKTAMTMQDIYEKTMSRCPESTAYIFFDENGKAQKRTYEEFANRIFITASKLSRVLSGVPRSAVIGLKMKNSPSWGIFFWALLMSGHRPLLLDARLAKPNADNLLRQAKASALISN